MSGQGGLPCGSLIAHSLPKIKTDDVPGVVHTPHRFKIWWNVDLRIAPYKPAETGISEINQSKHSRDVPAIANGVGNDVVVAEPRRTNNFGQSIRWRGVG